MTGVSLKAGARSSRGGPGCDRNETQDLAERSLAAASGSASVPGVVGRQGDRAAGLVLRADSRNGEGEIFQVAIVDAKERTMMTLGPYAEDEVIATWRGLGAASGLELMVASLDGALQKPYPQVGRVQLGQVRIRRRSGSHGARRPRFLVRRKTGRLPLRPEVYRGEPEFGTGPST